MTVVVGHAGTVDAGDWTDFTVERLAGSGYGPAHCHPPRGIPQIGYLSNFGFAIPADATITGFTISGWWWGNDADNEIILDVEISPGNYLSAYVVGSPLFGEDQEISESASAEGPLPSVAWLNSAGMTATATAMRNISTPVGTVYLYGVALTVEYDEYVPPDATVPTVTTTAVEAITPHWATSGGTVTSDGGSPVTNRGIVWGVGGVTLETAAGQASSTWGLGSYSCVADDLAAEGVYSVRAYAINAVGVAYGADVYFQTPRGIPTVATSAVGAITGFWASSGGTVTAGGWDNVTSRGIVWGVGGVTLETAAGQASSTWGLGDYYCTITDLVPGGVYSVRAYAINSYGVAYGADVYFQTLAAPTVVTTAVTAITPTTATGGGTIPSGGGGAVTDRGICWGTSPNPRTQVRSGDGTSAFAQGLTDLLPGTRYFVAAYAINSIGAPATTYGADVTFVTHGFPVVATAGVYDIDATVATGGGNVASDGGEAVTARGVCWSVAENPTTAGSKTTDGSGSGAFVSYLTGLTEGVTYNVRAYAVNLAGTAYGAAVIFTTTADTPPVEPPPGPPRDPSQNLLFDGTLELKVGTLDVAGSATQVKYSNSNPGGFGNLSFRLPADAPYAAFDAQVVKSAAVTLKHGLVGFVVTLFEGEVTSDVSHATIAGGKGYYDVTCAGLWWKAGQRKDFSMVVGDDDYGQWFTMDDNAKVFQVSTDGRLEIRLKAGQEVAAGDSASLYYWLGKGMGDPAASIDFLFDVRTMNVTGANWFYEVWSAPHPWGEWTLCFQSTGGTVDAKVGCHATAGDTPQALRLKLYTTSAMATVGVDRFFTLENVSVGSGVSANGLSAVSVANPTVVTANSAHGLKTGDRVFVTQTAESVPTIGGWRTVTVVDGAHFTVPVAVTTAGGAGTFYKATRIDQSLVEIAVTTGLATLASLQPGGIGNLNWGLNVRPHASRAGSIDLLSATNVAPFDYGFWDNATFHCKDRPLTILALHDYLIDSSLPGIDFDVRCATEDSPTVVKVLYKFRDVDGGTSVYPDGTAMAVYRDAGGAFTGDWSDAGVVLDVWNEWADLSLTTAQANDLGDQILAWLSANAYQGGGTIAPATVPLRAEGTKPAAYIRAGDYIEDSNLDTGPLMITGFSMDADRGIATIGIGENRRAFVERLTPDKA